MGKSHTSRARVAPSPDQAKGEITVLRQEKGSGEEGGKEVSGGGAEILLKGL